MVQLLRDINKMDSVINSIWLIFRNNKKKREIIKKNKVIEQKSCNGTDE